MADPETPARQDDEVPVRQIPAPLWTVRMKYLKGGMVAYTLKDLEEAQKEAKRWNEAWANDMSGNPNKYRSQIENATAKVRLIMEDLKESGALPKTPEEQLTDELDKLYPNAQSRSVVTYQEKKYQIRYFPLDISRSGKTVREWGHKWIPFEVKS